MNDLVVVRGAGDLATGVAWRLTRAGFRVVATELAEPLAVRRLVCLASAVREGSIDIDGLRGQLVSSEREAVAIASRDTVAVLVSAELPALDPAAVIDARVAKRNIDSRIDDAPMVVALGPGFEAGVDCHAVIETMRGPDLGRVIWSGRAAEDTGVPGSVQGHGADRVLRASSDGEVQWLVEIGDAVTIGEVLGSVGDQSVVASLGGVVRGLIHPGTRVRARLKIGDIEPRSGVDVSRISDKALAVGGAVVEAVFSGPPG